MALRNMLSTSAMIAKATKFMMISLTLVNVAINQIETISVNSAVINWKREIIRGGQKVLKVN